MKKGKDKRMKLHLEGFLEGKQLKPRVETAKRYEIVKDVSRIELMHGKAYHNIPFHKEIYMLEIRTRFGFHLCIHEFRKTIHDKKEKWEFHSVYNITKPRTVKLGIHFTVDHSELRCYHGKKVSITQYGGKGKGMIVNKEKKAGEPDKLLNVKCKGCGEIIEAREDEYKRFVCDCGNKFEPLANPEKDCNDCLANNERIQFRNERDAIKEELENDLEQLRSENQLLKKELNILKKLKIEN